MLFPADLVCDNAVMFDVSNTLRCVLLCVLNYVQCDLLFNGNVNCVARLTVLQYGQFNNASQTVGPNAFCQV